MVILRPILIVLLWGLLNTSTLNSQHTDHGWVLLNTLSNTPGQLGKISPDSQFVNISQGEVTRLVRIETGEVIAESTGSVFQFSPSGRYAEQFGYGRAETTLIDLQTGTTRVIEGFVNRYIDDERFAATIYRTANTNDINYLIDLKTGETVAEFPGIAKFSNDGRLAAITNIETRPHIVTQVIELATKNVLAEFIYDYANNNQPWGVYSVFHLNGRYLSIFYFPEEIDIIDRTTWQVLYRLPGTGGIFFSSDGRYLATANDDGNSDVQLLDAATGRVLDTVFGAYNFSPNSRYLLRNAAITYDFRRLEIVELSTDKVVFTIEGYLGEYRLVMENLLQLYNRETNSTLYFDIPTGALIREIDGWAELHHELLVVDDLRTRLRSLVAWESGETIATGDQIEVTPNGKYALVSSDGSIDLYGLADKH